MSCQYTSSGWDLKMYNKMSSAIPFTFNNIALFTVTVEGKPWTRDKEVCKAREYQKGRARDVLKKHVSIGNKQHKHELEGPADLEHPLEWPKNSQPDEYYINEEGMHELAFGTQQPRAKAFRKHCCNVMFPHIRHQLINKMVNDLRHGHQLAIEEHEQAIALLSEDLQDRHDQIRASQYGNVGLQGEIRAKDQQIAALQRHYVDHVKYLGKDNIIIIVRKHTTSASDKYYDLPYYVSRIQRHKRYLKLRWLSRHFLVHEVIVEIDGPSSIHAFKRFEEEGHAERRYDNFRLIHLTREELYTMGIPAILDYDEA